MPHMERLTNKKASRDYHLTETFDAGIELTGQEVKSLKQGLGQLEGSRVIVRGGEVFLIGSFIPPYQVKNAPSHDPHRVRRLLLHKSEMRKLASILERKELTLIPTALYGKGTLIKLSFSLGKRKDKKDKREALKARDSARDVRNTTFAWYDYE